MVVDRAMTMRLIVVGLSVALFAGCGLSRSTPVPTVAVTQGPLLAATPSVLPTIGPTQAAAPISAPTAITGRGPTLAATPSASPATSPSPTPSPAASPTASVPAPMGMLLFLQDTPVWEPYQIARIMNADGSGLRSLGHAVDASWSADGHLVHVVAPDAACVPSLITEKPDGSARVVVSRGLRSLDSAFTWSPDERQIVFLRFRNGPPPRMCGSQGGTYEGFIYDLWVMNADGNGARVLVPDFQVSGIHSAVWSPDSSRIAYLAPAKFPTQNGISTSVTFVRVSDGRRRDSGVSNVSQSETGLAWSPDGTRLAFLFVVSSLPDFAAHVGVVDAAEGSSGFLDLTSDADLAAAKLGVPIWSPDGRTIAVTREIDAADGSVAGVDILLLDAVKGGLVRDLGLTDAGGNATPTWSADGSWLAYVAAWDATHAHPGPIIEVASNGSELRIVPATAPAASTTDYVQWVQ
jgi:Tol biopolymer transport system component